MQFYVDFTEQERKILNTLFDNFLQEVKLIYSDFCSTHTTDEALHLTVDYIVTDVCDTIHDNILVGVYTKEVVPNIAFITYKQMYDLTYEKIKNKLK